MQHRFYCFVVRAACGFPVRTKDAMSNLDDSSCNWVYANPLKYTADGQPDSYSIHSRRELIEISGVTPPVRYHSLIAEVGGVIKRHKEFVTFEKTQTYCEYLLAYKRE